MTFAVEVTAEGFNLNNIGVILMIVGALGLVLSMIFWNSWGGFANSRRTTVGGGRRTVVEEEI